MFKSILTIWVAAAIFLLSGVQGWSDSLDDRFIHPDFSTAQNIFIDVKDVSLMDVLKIISKQSGLSFIASQDIADKKITLYLNKIPLNQALMTVLDANGLTYEMQGSSDVFVVKAKYKTEKTKVTKVYQLKYATVSTSKLNSTLSGSSGSSSSSGSGSTESGGLQEVLKDSLSADGKVIEDPRTNSLIITDVPGQFELIESTIAKLDVPIPQILIEVEMLDVSKSVADQLGIKYGANPMSFSGGSKTFNYPFGKAGTSEVSQGTFDATGMSAELTFLTTNTDARTLARPRILTLNNQTAQIQISTDQAISIAETQASTGSSGATVAGNTVERVTTGIILKVTPQANLLTREITMAVSPKVIDVILSQVQPPAGSTSQGAIYDPVTRGSDSMLKLTDGQSMVIGGLMTDQDNNTITKLPFLGDLPFVGSAFRHRNKSKNERELLIFLTPHIIDGSNPSVLKESKLSSVQSALDIQSASDRAQEINNILNNFDR